jgi:hypothetical protein
MPWCCLCGSARRTPHWATPEARAISLRNTYQMRVRRLGGSQETAEVEKIPRRSRRHSAPNGYAGLDWWSTRPGLPGWLTATAWVRHKLAVYTMAMGLTEALVADESQMMSCAARPSAGATYTRSARVGRKFHADSTRRHRTNQARAGCDDRRENARASRYRLDPRRAQGQRWATTA